MLKKNSVPIIIATVVFVVLAGCSQQEKMLIDLSESQSRMKHYVKQQEEFFAKLKDDIKNNRIKKGMSKEEVLLAYGEPIFCDPAENPGQVKERCLYRMPTQYFFTDLVYLEFDKDSKLTGWEMKPAKEQATSNNKE